MTKTEILARFTQMFPDCDSTTAGQLFDESHIEIMEELQIRASTLAISLTAGTREYALSATVQKITEAYYQPSSNEMSWIQLVPTSIQQLAEQGNWRAQNQQVIPTQYYVFSALSSNTAVNKIGFVQIPPTTTSASYPNVTLYGEFITDLSGSDEIPVAITYVDAYASLMAMKFVMIATQNPTDIAKWNQVHESYMQKNKASIKSGQFGNEGMFLRPSFINNMTRGR